MKKQNAGFAIAFFMIQWSAINAKRFTVSIVIRSLIMRWEHVLWVAENLRDRLLQESS